jgi:hypothetical protein
VKNPTPTSIAFAVAEARTLARRAFALSDYLQAVYLAMPHGEIVVDRAGRVTPAADYDAHREARFQADEPEAD